MMNISDYLQLLEIKAHVLQLSSQCEARFEQLEETVSTRGALIKRLQDAAAERKLTINSLQADLRDQESYISRLESSAAQHNAQIKELQAALARSQSQVQQLQASVADRDAHIGKLKWAAAQPYQSPSRITELQNSLADSQSHIKQLRAEVADRDTQIEKLKWSVSRPYDYSSPRPRVKELYDTIVAGKARIHTLEDTVRNRDAQIEKLKKEAAQPCACSSQTEVLQNTLREMKVEVADRDAQIEKLKKATKAPARLRNCVDFSYTAGVANRTPWNARLNAPYAKTRHIVKRYDEDLAAYDTEENGLVVRVQALLSRVYKYEERNTFRKKHKKDERYAPDDESGHLIAALFGGCGEVINMVPMTYNLNRYEWRDLERGWQDYLNANPNCQMFVDIKVLYDNNDDYDYDDDKPWGRPTGFRVSEYRVDANGKVTGSHVWDVFDNTY